MQRVQLNFEPGTSINLTVRVEELPALMKALGTLTIAEGESLYTMVKAQVAAASMMKNAPQQNAKVAHAAPDQNTQTREATEEPEAVVAPDLPKE